MITSSRIASYAPGTVDSRRNVDLMLSIKTQLDEVQRQVASGKKSETYGGLGSQRVSALSFRNQLGAAEGYSNLAELTGVRLSLLSQQTSQLGQLVEDARNTLLKTRGIGSYNELNSAKQNVQANFEQFVAGLNAQTDGNYLFSGRARDVKPVVDAATLMNGDGTNAGLKQVIDERRQADLGATGLGRLTTAVTGNVVDLAEEAGPFGIKLVAGSVGSAVSNLTSTGPTGAPATLSFTLAGQPATGDRLTFNVTLPDGKVKSLGFSFNTAGVAGDANVAIGATAADTANNLKNAITAKLTDLAANELRAASALAAANQFFAGSNSNPVQRVAGPPFNTSAGYAAAGTRPTITWYQGDDDTSIAARDTQRAEVSSGSSVSFGARANEAPFRDALVAMGLFLAEDYPANSTTTSARFDASASRAIDIFSATGGSTAILEVTSELGRVAAQVQSEKTRHDQNGEFLKELLGGIENVQTEEAAAQLLTLQNQLQASYQVTAKLSQLSLAQYL